MDEITIFQDSIFSQFPKLRLKRKENQTIYGKMTRKPRRYVKILIYMYQTWVITVKKCHTTLPYKHVEIEVT